MPACQQALFIVKVFIKCSLHYLLNIFYAFFYLIICIYTCMLKTCGLEKQLFLFHVLDLNPIFANQDPTPTIRPRNSSICPCLSRRRRSTHFFSSAGGVNACAAVLFCLHYNQLLHLCIYSEYIIYVFLHAKYTKSILLYPDFKDATRRNNKFHRVNRRSKNRRETGLIFCDTLQRQNFVLTDLRMSKGYVCP